MTYFSSYCHFDIFWCTHSIQSLMTYFSSYCQFYIFDVLILSKPCDIILLFALSLWYFWCTHSLQRLVTQLFYLYRHFDVLILSKVVWLNYFICIVTLIFLLYLFSPKSCDTIILFVLSLWYFCCTYFHPSFMVHFG